MTTVTNVVNNTVQQKTTVQTTTASTKPTVTTTVAHPVVTQKTVTPTAISSGASVASRTAAAVSAMVNKPATTPVQPKPVTSAVGQYNQTVLYQVKNALYGTGSLSETPHIGSIQADINNALKIAPKDTNLLTAQKALSTIGGATSANDTANALKTAQTALMNIYNESKGIKPTPTPNKPVPIPTPTPSINPNPPNVIPINPSPVTPTPVPIIIAPTPVINDPNSAVASDIRNSLYGKGSFETTALDYNKVNANINNALQLISKMPSANIVGNKTPTEL